MATAKQKKSAARFLLVVRNLRVNAAREIKASPEFSKSQEASDFLRDMNELEQFLSTLASQG